MKRSSKYDVFNKTPESNSGGFKNKTLKEKAKFAWKITKVVICVFLAALSLTGCIQSMVLQSSSTVGSGIELYNDANSIAPYVNNFKINKQIVKRFEFDQDGNIKYDKNGDPIYKDVEINVLDPLTKENYLVTDKTISEIKNELATNYSTEISDQYGSYDNRSSSLRIVGLDGKNISSTNSGLIKKSIDSSDLVTGTKQDGSYIFLNTNILKMLNEKGLSYQIQNNWYDINFFVAKKPLDNLTLSKDEQDVWGQGITTIANSFIPYEQSYNNGIGNNDWKQVQFIDGKYVTYDVNNDGVNDVTTPVAIEDELRISKFKYAFDADVVSVSKNDLGLFNSEKYARDFLQSLTNIIVQFDQVEQFIKEIFNEENLTVDQKFTTVLSKNRLKSLTISSNGQQRQYNQLLAMPNAQAPRNVRESSLPRLFTAKQKASIMAYQDAILDVVSKSGFGIKKQIYSDQSSEDSANWNDPYRVEFLPTIKDKKDKLIGAAPVEQKPIASWGSAWSLGPFYGLVVWPISFTINGLVGSMPPMDGWGAIIAIVTAVILTRILTTLFTYKSLFSQHKQQALAPKKAKIDAKYEGYKGNKQLEQRKRQEIADLYKKNNISMSGQFVGLLITMPIFLAVWRVIQGIAEIKSSTWLGIQFSATSWKELFNGAWQYLPLLIMAIIIQLASQLLPRYLNKKRMSERANVAEKAALKKANKTQNIMMFVFVFLAVAFEAGVQIYWIVGGIWQIFQTLLVHWIVKTDFYKEKLYKYV